ncbi:46d617b6-b905-4ce3-b3ef-7f9893f81754 [Sclerotinia trifoliorum]|uniref:46d617b6-b905-4ce3-b3ef-7f9893f81754 n=1 Tax=Sclerotinia trifoliorum TaxID=28548 RepID=A0A8H2ZKZ2_9HELO|nr:46d617b6-b905-4ce3-b3ef-7f9893f81754 [Sclerotinia trifoliorum]
MADPAQQIHFGDEIKPMRSNRSNRLAFSDVLAESKVSQAATSHDFEEKALEIANEDLNKKKKQTYTGWMLMWLAYQSVGVIYGDIGTSPLYVYSSTFTSHPSYDDLVGALSIIIWTLTLMVSVKYVFIVLSADDDGEGGTFALYSLLARYAHIVQLDPKVSKMVKMERHATNDLRPSNNNIRTFIEGSAVARVVLKFLGVLGVSMVMSDGVLTPAQSVLGAIQGLEVAQPGISTSTIVGATCAILILLFAIQPFGTTKIATTFAPIVMIWLLFNMCTGIYNLAQYDHTVLKAFSPYFAGAYFMRNKEEGWQSLGGLLLAFTGVEALFADLGAFSKRAVQISWLGLTYPCLLLAYIGQAAYISQDTTKTAYTNPFFNTVPPGTFYFALVIAVLAAIVASQAMITASFQLLSQVMRLSYFPHIKTVHTSKIFHGQVYMPFANWLLMIGTVIVTAVYSNTTRLGNAYGVCVIFVTFITTCMVSLVAIIIWRINVLIVLIFFLVFATLDGVYLSSALIKVPTGAWFTLLLAFILSCIFVLWRYGKEQQWTSEAQDRIPPSDFITSDPRIPNTSFLTPAYGSSLITTVPSIGIFFDKVGDQLPIVFTQFVRKFCATPEIIIFLHMRQLSIPHVPDTERYIIQRTSIPSCYRITIRHGYTDDIITPSIGSTLISQLILFITRDPSTFTGLQNHLGTSENENHNSNSDSNSNPNSTPTSIHHTPTIQAELDKIEHAASSQIVYVLGKEQMKIARGGKNLRNWARRAVLWVFLWIRENSRGKMADLDLPVEGLVEVGFVKVI